MEAEGGKFELLITQLWQIFSMTRNYYLNKLEKCDFLLDSGMENDRFIQVWNEMQENNVLVRLKFASHGSEN